MAWSGNPALAMISPAEIPAVASRSALDGLAAGFLAAVTYSGARTDAGRRLLDLAVVDARRNPDHDYDYSRAFLDGIEAAKAQLRNLRGAA